MLSRRFLQGEAQGLLVLRGFGNFHRGLAEKLHQFGGMR